ncbi:helix-turn-helix domain-containing protein [Gelatiniphilus marinus]|uniref:Helix-turn-helix domain-containing protein n=1 Tax=Gelatiniphilus marinus TaxID=1759464 RepID=A0ABW5JP79_9FLAO
MSSKHTSDLVLSFKNLIVSIKPYAKAQKVELIFQSHVESLPTIFDLEDFTFKFTKFIKKIISFTPESFKVLINFNMMTSSKHHVRIEIENTGADLSRIREITSIINYNCHVLKTSKGTRYNIDIPLNETTANPVIFENKNNLGYTPYYIEINRRLNTHFKEIESFELAADKKNKKEASFLRNTNKVINARMGDSNFKVDALAKAMALSRSQLFRKIKMLTQMSPNQYLLFYRLQIAKHIIETEENDLNISEVGYQVGFISKSHFSRSFQKQFGLSPSKYKKSNMQH